MYLSFICEVPSYFKTILLERFRLVSKSTLIIVVHINVRGKLKDLIVEFTSY